MDASFCLDELEEAMEKYGKSEIMSTDQGSQFTSLSFTQCLKENDIRISIDGKGAWRDNVFVERLWRTVKYEHVYLHAYGSTSEAKLKTGHYIEFYNLK
jgi:putative transposase